VLSARQALNFNIQFEQMPAIIYAVPRLKVLVACPSPWGHRFDPWPIHGIWWTKSPSNRFHSEHFSFTMTNVIPPMLDTHLHLHTTLVKMASRQSLITFMQSDALLDKGAGGRDSGQKSATTRSVFSGLKQPQFMNYLPYNEV
jgi:hypothetical protein